MVRYFCGGGVVFGCETVLGDCAGGSVPQLVELGVDEGIVEDAVVELDVLGLAVLEV